MSDAVLVIGGGITGLRASMDLAKAGARVVLVERQPTIGGKMSAALDEDTPDPAIFGGLQPPRMEAVAQQHGIEVITLGEVIGLTGEPGKFTATIRQRARYVSDACIRCGHCRQVCPVVQPNEFDAGLAFRKAIYSPVRNSVPHAYVIDIEHCLNTPPNYLACSRCVDACEDDAIDFSVHPTETFEREVASVVVATGFDVARPANITSLGYGRHPDVLTAMELERLLSTNGPTNGFIERPSNRKEPKRVLMVMLDTSRFAWAYTARHTARLADQEVSKISVLYNNQLAFTQGLSEYWKRTAAEGVNLLWGEAEEIAPAQDGDIMVRYRDGDSGLARTQTYDMVVIAAPVEPAEGIEQLAQTLGVDVTADGYVKLVEMEFGRTITTRSAVYVAGCATGPKNMADSIVEASTAAGNALRYVSLAAEEEKLESTSGRTGMLIGGKLLSQEDLQKRIEGLLLNIMERGNSSGGGH